LTVIPVRARLATSVTCLAAPWVTHLRFDVLRTSGEPIEQLGAVGAGSRAPLAGRAQLTCA